MNLQDGSGGNRNRHPRHPNLQLGTYKTETLLPALLLNILKYENSGQRFNSGEPPDNGGWGECRRKKSL